MNYLELFMNGNGRIKRENTRIEYKEKIGKNSYWKIQKAVLGLSNNKGGIVVIGVKDSPRAIINIDEQILENEFEMFQHYMNDRYGSQLNYSMETLKVGINTIGIIDVKEATEKPIICSCSDGELKQGSIYYRYMGESTFIKKNELDKIIDTIKKKEAKKWEKAFKALIDKGISNVTILDLNSGEIGTEGKFYIDHSMLQKLKEKVKFIEEGRFDEKEGAPALKLVGEIVPQNVIYSKRGGFDPDKYKYSATAVAKKLGINKNLVKKLIKYFGIEGNDEYYTEIKYGKSIIIQYTNNFIKMVNTKIPKRNRKFQKLKELIEKQ